VKLYDEIAKIAYELYEKGGRSGGRELDNWLEAERIAMARHREQEKPGIELPSSPKKKNLPSTKVPRKEKKSNK
jgi:hypothetical protein